VVLFVGAGGFEPPTSRTRTVHSIRAEPRPVQVALYFNIPISASFGLASKADFLIPFRLLPRYNQIILGEISMMSHFLLFNQRWWSGSALLMLAFLVSACASPAAAVEIQPGEAATATIMLPTPTDQIPSPTLSPTLSPTANPTATPSPIPTATAAPRILPDLPPVFTSDVLKEGDIPHTYIEDTCQYLKARWDADSSPPGTVVMPIMFHSITKGGVNYHDQMTVAAFDALMQALVDAGFEAINTEQLVAFLEDNAKIPPRSVVLIVDDRKREAYYVRHFKPYYDSYGWPVVNAWISAVDTPASLWMENARLAQAGWVDHQAHGVVHNIPATSEVEDEYIENEMNGSVEAIQQYFGKRPVAYIWPGGGFTHQAVALARETGFRVGFTVNPRGPVMYNWVPLAEAYNPKRPTYIAEGPIGDPLMVLPRYWSTDAIWHIERVVQIGEAAAAEARRNRSLELEYYDIVCRDVTGQLSIEYP
jgi:peptidoglycan/xylan/chitin deacetylase (PgdA/CDA1 family)